VVTIVGREAEFAALGAALRRADLSGVLLTGEPGVGKTHLLAAALDHAEDMGFATVTIHGTRALADIPLAAFAALLPGRPVGDAGDLVHIRLALRERAGGRPLLLGVDDAHLLDEASAALVHQVASDLTAFVLGTMRVNEVPPDAIAVLVKDGIALRIPVGPLPRDAIGAFAAATLGAPVTGDVEEQLWDRTLGNPLFAKELLLGAKEAGSFTSERGGLRLTSGFSAPSTLTELVEARLAELGEVQQRAVALVAVGGPLEVDLIERLVDPDALVTLEGARILVADEVDDSLVVRFVHPAYAEIARRRLGRLTARQLLRDLARALEATGTARPDDVLRIASWRLDGGEHAGAELLRTATRVAMRRNDFALAERLGTTWFDHEPSLAAATLVAAALVEQGRHAEARVALGDPRADRTSAREGDLVRAALLSSTIEFWGLGDARRALQVLDEALAAHPGAADVLRGAQAAIHASAGDPRVAVELAPPGSAAAATPLGLLGLTMGLTTLGRPAHALEAVPAADGFPGFSASALVAVTHVFAMIEAGQVQAAQDVSAAGWERAVRDGDLHGQAGWAIALGWADINHGRRAAALRWFTDAAELSRVTAAATHGVRWALGGALLCSAQAGDLDAARALRDRLDDLPPHDAVVHAYMEFRGRAWLQALEGDVDGAVAALASLAEGAIAAGRVAPWLRAVVDVARLDRPTAAAALLRAHDVEVDGPFLQAMRDAVDRLAARDPDGLADVAERLAACGFRVIAAEAAAGAWVVAREDGHDARTVAQLGRRAQELRDAIEVYATPALSVDAPEVSLSRREREIALLVAEGRTSREVADELIIGVRTVESHLARVYAKLGVRSRSELAEALGLAGAAT